MADWDLAGFGGQKRVTLKPRSREELSGDWALVAGDEMCRHLGFQLGDFGLNQPSARCWKR